MIHSVSNGRDRVMQTWYVLPTATEDYGVYTRTGTIVTNDDGTTSELWDTRTYGEGTDRVIRMWWQMHTDLSVVPVSAGGTGATTA